MHDHLCSYEALTAKLAMLCCVSIFPEDNEYKVVTIAVVLNVHDPFKPMIKMCHHIIARSVPYYLVQCTSTFIVHCSW